MTDTKQFDRVRRFYFENVEGRDAELVQLRDGSYKGDTAYMLRTYQSRLVHPNADIKVLSDDIKRLKSIYVLEAQLASLKIPFNGGNLMTVSPLVEKYEGERKKGSDTTGLSRINEDATPHSLTEMLREFYFNEIAGEDVDLLVEAEHTCTGDLGLLRQSYDSKQGTNGCAHDVKRIDHLINLQSALAELNLRQNSSRVDLAYLVHEFENERATFTPKSETQVVKKYFPGSPTTRTGT